MRPFGAMIIHDFAHVKPFRTSFSHIKSFSVLIITFDGDGYYEGYNISNEYNEYNDYSDCDDNTPLKTIAPVKCDVETSFHIRALSVPVPPRSNTRILHQNRASERTART